jgi:hypothetical protein
MTKMEKNVVAVANKKSGLIDETIQKYETKKV